jgi:hypothetical protein
MKQDVFTVTWFCLQAGITDTSAPAALLILLFVALEDTCLWQLFDVVMERFPVNALHCLPKNIKEYLCQFGCYIFSVMRRLGEIVFYICYTF